AGPRAERVDLKGACLYPGFIESHSHLSLYAAWKPYAYCVGARSLAEPLEILAVHAAGRPADTFVVGYGFDDTAVSEKRGPLRQELDALWPDRPAALVPVSVPAASINSRPPSLHGIPTALPPPHNHVSSWVA
ncbi:amidohydrolase, partial [Muribaculaceae bacterium Isolate-002 (NCI)]